MSKVSGIARFTRAVLTRMVFSFHATVTVWFLTKAKQSTWPWFLLLSQIGNLVEVIITLKVNRGHEWKWFCPSVLFYLMSSVPPFWLLELHGLDSRIQAADGEKASVYHNVHDIITATPGTLNNTTHVPPEAFLILGVDDNVWRKILEQGLLLLLIIGRWTLPKGALTHDQLSQLLLVYMGMAADIAVFYDSFTEPGVQTNRFMSCVILAVWTASLLQFTLVLTEGSASRSDQMRLLSSLDEDNYSRGCHSSELCGIIISIFLQDLPFLIVRVVLIVRFDVISYTNLFFTAKNSLVIVFLLYRVIVIRSEAGDTSNPGVGVLLSKNDTSDPGIGVFQAENKSDKARLTRSVSPSRSTRPELPLTTFLLTQDGGRVKSRSKLRGHSQPR